MKEETLSDKISCNWCSHGCDEPHDCKNHMSVLYVEDVKESIKKLKKDISYLMNNTDYDEDDLIEAIDIRAGDKLTKE
jgi:hypothetical protein